MNPFLSFFYFLHSTLRCSVFVFLLLLLVPSESIIPHKTDFLSRQAVNLFFKQNSINNLVARKDGVKYSSVSSSYLLPYIKPNNKNFLQHRKNRENMNGWCAALKNLCLLINWDLCVIFSKKKTTCENNKTKFFHIFHLKLTWKGVDLFVD